MNLAGLMKQNNNSDLMQAKARIRQKDKEARMQKRNEIFESLQAKNQERKEFNKQVREESKLAYRKEKLNQAKKKARSRAKSNSKGLKGFGDSIKMDSKKKDEMFKTGKGLF